MTVRSFRFEAALTDAFVALGREPYRNDPCGTPPSPSALRATLAPSAAFYRRPGHDHCRFLALAGGRPVARALASLHPELRDRDGASVGALGFFESVDDGAGLEVIAAAVEWLRGKGRRRIWGPLQLDIWHGYRFMTRGFEESRHLAEPYNPPHYPELFARSGFSIRQRWNSFPLPGRGALEEIAAAGSEDVRRLAAEGYRFASLRGRATGETLDALHSALHDSFSRFLGFTAISREEFQGTVGELERALERSCSVFATAPSGALVGFEVSFLDLAAAVQAMRGRTTFPARLAFLWEGRNARRLLLHLGGLTSALESRRPGLARAVVSDVLRRVKDAGYQEVLVTLVAEGNPVRRYFGPYAKDVRREYALFQLEP